MGEDGAVRPVRVITVALLVVLILAGWAGGAALLIDRTGGMVGMTVDQLPPWMPLADYTLLGIALIVLFGLLPIAAVVLLVRRSPRGWTATTAVGLLLLAWTVGQLVVFGLTFPAVHAGILIAGILLTALGVDGAATDESQDAVPSYEYADDDS
jgi:hypothetical protein